MLSQSKYENQKVSQNRLSALMKFILLNADGRIERGEIVEKYYHLERRYRGYYAESCLRGKQRSRYDRQYRRAQPAITKALLRLENRGLVRLTRHGKYVKELNLTEKGVRMAHTLSKASSDNQGK